MEGPHWRRLAKYLVLGRWGSASDRYLFTDRTLSSDLALAQLEELQREMEPGEYAQVHAVSSSRWYGLVAKELIDTNS